MAMKILITGATSGIGYETARTLAEQGHHLLVHGRSAARVEALEGTLQAISRAGPVEGFVADLANLGDIKALAATLGSKHDALDVLINNAGVLKTPNPITAAGYDVRFVVNTIAPWVLTQGLLPQLGSKGRVINLSSAAQSPVNLEALLGHVRLSDFEAYSQSKLALTMWSCHLGRTLAETGPVMVAVNPGSMLGTNMVRKGFGVPGKDVRIGSDILARAATSDEFARRSGAYFDNDAGRFAAPHSDALSPTKCEAVITHIEKLSK